MWRTAALMLAISPLPVLPFVTPQSIRMCCEPSADGTVTRKKSPKPTRYMRIRSSPSGFAKPLALGLAFVFAVGFVFRGIAVFAFTFAGAFAISEPPVGEREIDHEAILAGALDEAEPLVGRALA